MWSRFLIALTLLIANELLSRSSFEAFALSQHRCGGVIQYRPCNDDRSIPALLNERALTLQINNDFASQPSFLAQMKLGLIQPTVFSSKYHYDKGLGVGVWTGFVHGEGSIVLRLRLNAPGSPPELRYMGKANLRGRPSPFEFRSTPPKGSRWSWQINAKNEENS